jgi:uncharacterized protein
MSNLESKKSEKTPDARAFLLSIHELPRRSGEYRDYQMTISLDRPFGLEMIAVPSNHPIELAVTATSVDEGIFIRGRVQAEAVGECARCLAPLEMTIDQGFDELYEYESKAASLSEEDVETDQILFVVEEQVDLAIPVRDAVILALPVNPLCEDDCPGLCTICGTPWRELDSDHAHEERDPRWRALEGLVEQFKEEDK